MSDPYSNFDPDFAVATLGRALRELLATFSSSAPEHDADGGEYSSWWLMLRPAADDWDEALLPAAAPTVTVSVGSESTRIEVSRPVSADASAAEAFRIDGGAGGVIVEGSPYAVQLPAGIVRILTRLVMDLVYCEEHAALERGVCQLCGKGRALSIWRPR